MTEMENKRIEELQALPNPTDGEKEELSTLLGKRDAEPKSSLSTVLSRAKELVVALESLQESAVPDEDKDVFTQEEADRVIAEIEAAKAKIQSQVGQ